MKMDMKERILFITLIVVLLGIGVALQIDRQSLQKQAISLQQEVINLQGEVTSQQEGIASLQEEVASQQAGITSLQDEIASLQEEIASLEEKLKGTLPYGKADSTPITLQNNFGGVSNPTWSELKAFLGVDNTEEHRYDYASFVCGDFAEMLHNRAEEAGIRAGVAIVHFAWGPSHALNVFYTADRGLVYVDDTGADMTLHCTYSLVTGVNVCAMFEGEDTIAYVVEGEEYGQIPTEMVTGFSYNFYVDYRMRWSEYNLGVEMYNAECDAYNSALGDRVFLEEPEYSEFMRWYNELEQEQIELERLSATLGDYWYEPLGIVNEVEIYWNSARWDINESMLGK